MKTNNVLFVNFHILIVLFLVLCPGKNSAWAQVNTVKSQLHIPWKLLSARLRAISNKSRTDGSDSRIALGNHLISAPYNGEVLNWNLTSGTAEAKIDVSQAAISPGEADVALKSTEIQIVLDQLNLDQVIVRDIGGVQVRVHLNASCGPITIHQKAAQARAAFALNWSTSSPQAALSKLDLSWAPNTWTFDPFTCTGPSGLDQEVRNGIANYLRDPADFKPYIETYISQNLSSEIDAVMAKVRTPFAVGSSKESITIAVGTLAPTSTGVIADLTFKSDARAASGPARPVPSASVLAALPSNQPALIGDLDLISFIVATKLSAQPNYYRMNLQTVPAFHKLMHSRISQIFAWGDLLHYNADAPFYLNVKIPRRLTLTHTRGSVLSSTVPVSSMIQSYRDSQWWDWVDTTGSSSVSVTAGVKAGSLSYATTVNTVQIKSRYGSAYTQRYNKDSDNKIPDSIVAQTLTGPRPELSGSMKMPDVDLDVAGKYRATSMKWITSKTFSLAFSSL